MKRNQQHKFKGPTPGWFKCQENKGTISNNNRRLLNPLNQQPTLRFTFTSLNIHSSLVYYRPPNEWTITWDSNIPNLTADTRSELTPKKRQPALQPCPVCDKHTTYYRDLRPHCVLVSQNNALIKFHVHSSSYILPFPTNSKKFNIP